MFSHFKTHPGRGLKGNFLAEDLQFSMFLQFEANKGSKLLSRLLPKGVTKGIRP